jgi:hypothetical protein
MQRRMHVYLYTCIRTYTHICTYVYMHDSLDPPEVSGLLWLGTLEHLIEGTDRGFAIQ